MARTLPLPTPQREVDFTVTPLNADGTVMGGSGAASDQVQGAGPSGATAVGNPVGVGGFVATANPTLTAGQRSDWLFNTTGAGIVAIGTGPAAVASVGQMSSDGLSTATFGVDVRAFVYGYNGATRDRLVTVPGAPTSGLGVQATALTPHSSANGAVTPTAVTAVSASQIAKASAGNLYGFNVTTGATAGYIMLFNSTTVPADGAVTPVKVYQVAANTTTDRSFNMPLRFSTGIVIVFSSTGPFTKTGSATAFIESETV